MSDIRSTDIEKTAQEAEELTKRFTEKKNVGEKKTAETSDDIAEGMPEQDQENLHKTTNTD